MAKKTNDVDTKSGDTPPAPDDHNFAKMSEVYISCFEKLLDAETKEKDAIAKYVQCFRDDKKQIKADMKATTEGMETKDFNLWYNIYKRQQEAKQMEQEDRTRILTNIAVVFDAVTGQGCMIDCISDFKAEVANKKVDAKSPDNLPGDGAEETADETEDDSAEESGEASEQEQL